MNTAKSHQAPDQRIIDAIGAARKFDCAPAVRREYGFVISGKPVYIAGPMSGLPELNYPAFHAAAQALRDMGYEAENPAENQEPNSAPTWADWMRLGLRQMLRCRSVLLLSGWRDSKGAIIEARTALDLGMLVIDGETGGELTVERKVVPTESVLVEGVAYDTPVPVAAEMLRLHLELKQAAQQHAAQQEGCQA